RHALNGGAAARRLLPELCSTLLPTPEFPWVRSCSTLWYAARDRMARARPEPRAPRGRSELRDCSAPQKRCRASGALGPWAAKTLKFGRNRKTAIVSL